MNKKKPFEGLEGLAEQDSSESAEESKIIVDEDWKTQVEREKEELRRAAEEPPASSDVSSPDTSEEPETGGDGGSDASAGGDGEEMQLPPASFAMLVSTLATQAMSGMGVLPDPGTGKSHVNRPLAKHFIDMLVMLQEKTKGNLSDEETAQIRDALHQLRMIFLSIPASAK